MSLEVVKQVRSGYPTPLGGDQARFLVELAQTLHGGLLIKDSGAHVTLPNGRNVAGDIFFSLEDGHIYDVLIDQEGPGEASWQDKGPGDFTRFYKVLDDPLPAPVPAPSPVDLKPLQDRIVALELAHQELRKDFESALAVTSAALMRLDDRYVELATPRTIRTEKSGRGFLAHSHEVKL